MSIERVSVIGTGMMGPGIAAVIALAGCDVMLIGKQPEAAGVGVSKAQAVMKQLLAYQLTDAAAVAAAADRVHAAADLAAGVQRAQLVIEAIYENLPAKQELFRQLDEICAPDVILATNTSGLSVTEIVALATHRERTATTHFWVPPHLVPLVEVVMGLDTSENTAQMLLQFLRRCGKQPVLVRKDLPGQLANRLLQAMIREATSLVQAGIASPEDVDTAIKNGVGIRLPEWGVLEHIDAVGLDLCLNVQNTVLPSLNNEPHAVAQLAERVQAGHLGVKSGHGYYDLTVKDIDALKQRRDEFIVTALRFRDEHK